MKRKYFLLTLALGIFLGIFLGGIFNLDSWKTSNNDEFITYISKLDTPEKEIKKLTKEEWLEMKEEWLKKNEIEKGVRKLTKEEVYLIFQNRYANH